jgi:DNA-binding XRE family transcriptional regulator
MAIRHAVAPAPKPGDIRARLALSRERMARLMDVSAKTIERWEARADPPSGRMAQQRLAQLREIVDLGLTVYTPEGLYAFLRTPLPAFDGRSALQLIELGDAERVIAELVADYEGLGS